eukprot:5999499-Prymnesium_polylepis.1
MCGADGSTASDYKTQNHLQPVPASEAASGDLVVEELPITFEGVTYPHGRIAYVKGREPTPAIFVHHNYAGCKQFDVDQASYLALCGYTGVAVDLYPECATFTYADRSSLRGDTPVDQYVHFQGAFEYMQSLLVNPARWRALMAASVAAADAHPAVAAGKAGCVGYCLGGQSCLEQLRAGHSIQALVTLHGLLHSRPMVEGLTVVAPDGTEHPMWDPLRRVSADDYAGRFAPPPSTMSAGCIVLVENGADDEHVPNDMQKEWIAEMDRHGVDWRLTNHARTPHGFALAPGVIASAYDEAADRRSTLSMLAAFAEAWPSVEQHHVARNASGTTIPYALPPSTELALPDVVKRARR